MPTNAVGTARTAETREGLDFTGIRAAGARAHRHAAETFAIEGEGVVGESAGGRPVAAVARAAKAAPAFRFSRVGPKGKRLPEATLRKLAVAMIESGGGAVPGIPAGYTYLGQFVDHDLTMDKTVVMFGASISPADLVQGRSPALDLDSLYGGGPGDPGSEAFYRANGLELKVGRTADGRPFDLPRDGDSILIPDHRNDENLAVGQTHLAFIKFHNRVVDELASVPQGKRFAKARRAVVKHYQWMLRTDYLPRICREAIVDDVFANGRKLVEPDAAPATAPKMPIEFSVGAFRLGHSMIRASYSWNTNFPNATLAELFAFSGTGGALSAGNRLPGIWIADWRRMYRLSGSGPLKAPNGTANRAMRIDTRLVDPLRELPEDALGGPTPDLQRNLAFRNLVRGRMVRLATGQDMVAKLKSQGVNVTPLTKKEIIDGEGGADLGTLTKAQREAVAADTPLWFYVLREAELNDGVLKGVGARIVAETFHRAMEGSKASIIRHAEFTPHFATDGETFGMPELLKFAYDGDPAKLNPEG